MPGWTSTLSISNRRLAVVGDPIEHSRSPQLHRAAYAELGLPWVYERERVQAGELSSFVAGLDSRWLGLSVTMPLKTEAFNVASDHDKWSLLAGVSNTIVLNHEDIKAFNTDVAGIVDPLRRLFAGTERSAPESAVIIGAGATAASAVIAVAELGCRHVSIVARDTSRATHVRSLCQQLDVTCDVKQLDELSALGTSGVTISTIPGSEGVRLDMDIRAGDVLLDIAYDVWPSINLQRWQAAGGHAINGLAMLSAQALRQVRIFVNGSPDIELPNEPSIRSAMNAAVGLDESGLFALSVG